VDELAHGAPLAPRAQGLEEEDEVEPGGVLAAVAPQGVCVAEDLADEEARRVLELVDDGAQLTRERDRVGVIGRVHVALEVAVRIVVSPLIEPEPEREIRTGSGSERVDPISQRQRGRLPAPTCHAGLLAKAAAQVREQNQ
jgi:hypothetical protein